MTCGKTLLNDFLMNGKIGSWDVPFKHKRKSEKGRMFFMFPVGEPLNYIVCLKYK